MTTKILHALKPTNLSAWEVWPIDTSLRTRAYDVARFWHKRMHVQVISAIEIVLEEGEPKSAERPEYHLSLSRAIPGVQEIQRITSNDARAILGMFGESGFLEDNHVPNGRVRNFWRPVAEPMVGEVCRCVDDEPEIREDKGDYVWRGITK